MSVEEAFLKSLKEAYECGKGCDVEIQVEDQKFKASKHLLIITSPVFKAMFENNTEESRTDTIKIVEFKSPLVEKFLLFLHTGKLSDWENDAHGLFEISNYYDVTNLRTICLKAIFSQITPKNAVECFELAKKFDLAHLVEKSEQVLNTSIDCNNFLDRYRLVQKHQSESMEKAIIGFMKENLWKVAKTEEWKEIDTEMRLELLQQEVDELDLDTMKNPKNLNAHLSRLNQDLETFIQANVKLDQTNNELVEFRLSKLNKQLDQANERFSQLRAKKIQCQKCGAFV